MVTAHMFQQAAKSMVLTAAGCLLFSTFASASVAPDANGNQGNIDANRELLSVYNNKNNRPDPFLPVALKGLVTEVKGVVSDSELKLQGIIMHPTRPVAVINRQSMALNEQVTLKLRSGEITAKAILIERSRVILKIGDRELELQIER